MSCMHESGFACQAHGVLCTLAVGWTFTFGCLCVYMHRVRDKGLRTAALIRFIGQEDGLLSHTHDGPRMYINLEGGCAFRLSAGSCSHDAAPLFFAGVLCCA
jgi:hypothetical protein